MAHTDLSSVMPAFSYDQAMTLGRTKEIYLLSFLGHPILTKYFENLLEIENGEHTPTISHSVLENIY